MVWSNRFICETLDAAISPTGGPREQIADGLVALAMIAERLLNAQINPEDVGLRESVADGVEALVLIAARADKDLWRAYFEWVKQR